MILSGLEIENEIRAGNIAIDPFRREQLNPNSYNLRLADELLVYDDPVLDMKRRHACHTFTLGAEGLVLEPGRLYLGRTLERTETRKFVPMLEGRSSVGRLGIMVHVTAGFGDVGFCGFWTLEIFCVQPVRIYPFVEICQIYYHVLQGDCEPYEHGKYQHNTGVQPSLLYRDFPEGGYSP